MKRPRRARQALTRSAQQLQTYTCALALGLFLVSLAEGQPLHAVSGRAMAPGPQGRYARAGSQGYLGVDVRDVQEDRVGLLRLKDSHGAEIIRVDHDGPAGKMGLRERDVVLQMNGVPINGQEHLRRMLRETPAGNTVVLTISRDGQQMIVAAAMADREQVDREAWEKHLASPGSGLNGPQAPANALPGFDASSTVERTPVAPAPATRYSKGFLGTLLPNPSYTGAALETMGPQLAEFFGVPGTTGLLVRSVAENSPASIAGMHAGDIVTRANAHAVRTMGDWAKMVHAAKGRPITVVVMRERQEKTLMLTPDGKKRAEIELPSSAGDEVKTAQRTEL